MFVNLKFRCGNEDDSITTFDDSIHSVFKNTVSGGTHTIENAQDFFDHTTTNSNCGIKSIKLFVDAAGLTPFAFGTVNGKFDVIIDLENPI
jgi:hypothetical protein